MPKTQSNKKFKQILPRSTKSECPDVKVINLEGLGGAESKLERRFNIFHLLKYPSTSCLQVERYITQITQAKITSPA